MWEELVEAGLDPKEAKFYLTALSMDSPTVARVAEAASISRTNAYDITRRLVRRGLVSLTEVPGAAKGKPGRGGVVIQVADPQHLMDEWDDRRRKLEDLVPQLRAIHAKGGTAPRSRYLEGAAGIRSALFETLEWPSPLRGILSMHDLLNVPGPSALREYIEARRAQGTWLYVVRSSVKETKPGWPSSDEMLRRTRYAPPAYVFTMTLIIGQAAVAMISSTRENFALVIESAEYADMQTNLFEVLWSASSDVPER